VRCKDPNAGSAIDLSECSATGIAIHSSGTPGLTGYIDRLLGGEPMRHVPVLIVGGSPVGLTASILLSQQGVKSLLVERHPGTAILPKARGIKD
jgi:hypothetical protein